MKETRYGERWKIKRKEKRFRGGEEKRRKRRWSRIRGGVMKRDAERGHVEWMWRQKSPASVRRQRR